MRDRLEIGATPYDEDCEQLGPNYDVSKAKRECRALIGQLIRELGEPPEGASLRVVGQSHDFGTYHEVACYFDDSLPESVEYAFACESKCPANWDEVAKQELQRGVGIS